MTDIQALTAGSAEVTLSNDKWHWVYKIKRPRKNKIEPGQLAPLFVSVKSGHSFSYVGIVIDPINQPRLIHTKRSRFDRSMVEYRAAAWMLRMIKAGGERALAKHGFRLQWANKCICCGRKLTTPSSIDSRIGPECAKRYV